MCLLCCLAVCVGCRLSRRLNRGRRGPGRSHRAELSQASFAEDEGGLEEGLRSGGPLEALVLCSSLKSRTPSAGGPLSAAGGRGDFSNLRLFLGAGAGRVVMKPLPPAGAVQLSPREGQRPPRRGGRAGGSCWRWAQGQAWENRVGGPDR